MTIQRTKMITSSKRDHDHTVWRPIPLTNCIGTVCHENSSFNNIKEAQVSEKNARAKHGLAFRLDADWSSSCKTKQHLTACDSHKTRDEFSGNHLRALVWHTHLKKKKKKGTKRLCSHAGITFYRKQKQLLGITILRYICDIPMQNIYVYSGQELPSFLILHNPTMQYLSIPSNERFSTFDGMVLLYPHSTFSQV